MDFSDFKTFIETLAPLTEDDWSKATQMFTMTTVDKHGVFNHSGHVCDKMGFVLEGIMRSYSIVDGKEVTTFFQFPGTFAVAVFSFIEQKPSKEAIQAIEKTKLLVISRKDLFELYKENWKWQQIGRILIEQNYIQMENRLLMLQSKNAIDKYRILMETNKDVIKYVPLQYISSYLGITPETLSRIRKKI